MGKRVVIALGGNALGNNLPEQMIMALAGGDHAVAGDEGGRHAAQCLDGEGQRGDVHDR